jgi:hypothetical protein
MTLTLSPLSFSDLTKNLEYCDSLFLDHQILLMHKKTGQAFAVFEQLVQIRKVHLAVMEECLLPAFLKTADTVPEGAKPLYFEREKKQIFKFLEIHARKLGNTVLHSEKLEIVTLFEDYAWLKDLLDHHDAREKAFLFPALDALNETKRAEILENVSAQLLSIEGLVK